MIDTQAHLTTTLAANGIARGGSRLPSNLTLNTSTHCKFMNPFKRVHNARMLYTLRNISKVNPPSIQLPRQLFTLITQDSALRPFITF